MTDERCWPPVSLQIFSIPGEVAIKPVFLIRRNGYAVELSGIDDQFRGDAQGPEGLIHLLATGSWDVEVFFTTEEQGGGFDPIGVQERVGYLQVSVNTFPGHS